ncbi:acetate kinase [Povalibacter uvarum]|uniref:Acetate kinase n=1 Tax=Povalibacter uvarum TaxID=732238 RepID=A0A841HSC8_9GAMM|nr:acetate/propionate family kinase [Povalibacter uvarum]MBB6095110.1 acetate kinase [Povalibacter uvarum]
MRIFALNCGSSSIKAALIETDGGSRLLEMHIENLGSADCRLLIGEEREALEPGTDAKTAIKRLIAELRSRCKDGPQAIAHRVVHGGSAFVQPTLLDDNVLSEIEALSDLAPLHNPVALAAIGFAREQVPDLPHVAVFDTAFHSTLPPRAREYALPRDVAQRFGIRRYGFHGTSHAQVTRAVAQYLKSDVQSLRIVSCHLGNGASVAAVEYGRSVETSMGMTPLEGLVMGTRSGDVDPGVLLHLLKHGGYDAESLDKLLNSDSGLKGLAGTNDLRTLEERAGDGDEASRLALTLYAHRVRKYIGAYAAVMGGVDVIAFTGGIGQHSPLMRHRILQRLDFLGARLDEDRNRDAKLAENTPVCEISDETSRARLLVVTANEEMEIALQTAALLAAGTSGTAMRIPIEISARHAHLTQATIEKLFGPGHHIQPRTQLSQPGQYAAAESVVLIGPRGRIEKVRLMGPPRKEDQVEISRSDEFVLGIDAPVRLSGDLRNTPGITLEGPAGRVTIPSGVICARRHIHMNPRDARHLGVRDHDSVQVRIDSDGRDLVFSDVVVRVSEAFELRLHLDTDEANAAGVRQGDTCELVRSPPRRA